MKTKIGCWALLALTMLAGCVPSLNPVYTEEDLVFDKDVLGVWVQPRTKASWELSKRDDKSYRLVYTDDQGREGRFVAHVAKLDGTLFLDLFPEETAQDVNGFSKLHQVPIHTVYQVRRTHPQLELGAIDFKWLDQYLTDHPDAIQFAAFGGRKLISAPTKDLQAFLLKHKERFTGKIVLERPASP